MNALERNAVQALSVLNIKYRSLICKNGAIFFCTGRTGFSFDLWVNHSGDIRIWRLLPDALHMPKNVLYTFKDPGYPHAASVIRCSSEGEITYEIQARISQDAIGAVHQLCRTICGYEQLINRTIAKI